jgi:hypothetical protein
MELQNTHNAADFEKRLREGSIRPLVVRPRVARRLLGGISTMKLWRLLNTGQLDSYLDGRARMITVTSIERYVARLLADSCDENGRLKQYDDELALSASSATDAVNVKAPRNRRRGTDQTHPVAAVQETSTSVP